MADAVDAIQQGWRRELPGVPVESIGVITRAWRVAKILGDDRRRTLARLGTDVATLDLLSTLHRSGPPYAMTPRDLARASLISAGAISQRVARAEAAGLVSADRGKAGHRAALIRLTDHGRERNEQVVRELLAHEQELVELLPAEYRDQLAALLGAFLTGLNDRLGIPDEPGQVGEAP